jgi:aminocarboxymuconate-semialdehyde decarboxylase
MPNRRELLGHAAGALAGFAFVGCGLTLPARAQALQERREVVVNRKRVRTVDVHAHCHIPEANALMGLKVQLPSLVVSRERIKAMDEQGIDIEALSINPIFWYKAEPDLAGQVVNCKTRSLPRSVRRNPTGSSVWVRSLCSTPNSPPSSSTTQSGSSDCAAR